ncbi:MAG: hypothetical protein Q8M93_00040 [Polaromonas sp.]|uniref:hypothetical protein n=1 Tax=Polaromonas sp. TaxID=1869339 RepID=UPI0027314AAE|nr:hypothetical protein [Polaromonas sp.]MDP2450213.1 hypothetical protein [Polaromonas sp.]MDP3245343.1 hypothetical protein [Polaromonas sp.]MDP3756527.1 hypothetical protein [Polaromonas sp.]MDP3829107.1 hypothetical protein [Polaromonas sp.]
MKQAVNLPSLMEFFASRWRGEVPLPVLFWRDMLVVGSLINLTASFATLMLIAQGASPSAALLVHFAPLPYNLFLYAAVWRLPQHTSRVKWIGTIWFLAVVFF